MAETRHLTVMFTDIKGFTKKTSFKKRDELESFLDIHEQLIVPIFKELRGRVVKTIGDAFMVVFSSPTNAVLCGMKVQDVLKKYNNDPKNREKVEVRVAINSGEVNIRDNDVYGEAVNIASRIEGIAEPNEVYFTESVYLAMNKSEIPSAEIGYRKLRGIPEEIKVYKVLKEPRLAEKAQIRREKLLEKEGLGIGARMKGFWKRRKWWIIGIFIALLIIGAINSPLNIIKKESSIEEFVQKAESAIQTGNYEEARLLANKISQIPLKKIPPKLALEGAKLYAFLREPEKAVDMIKIARANYPTREEAQQINDFINSVMEKATPEQREKLKELLSSD